MDIVRRPPVTRLSALTANPLTTGWASSFGLPDEINVPPASKAKQFPTTRRNRRFDFAFPNGFLRLVQKLIAPTKFFAWAAFKAWDRAQECVNGCDLTVRHVLERHPRHNLELRAVEWGNICRVERRNPQQAVSGYRGICTKAAIRVGFIQVNTCPNDVHKLHERVIAFW